MNFTVSQKGSGSPLEFLVDGKLIPADIGMEYLRRENAALSAGQSAEQFLYEAVHGVKARLDNTHLPFHTPVASGAGRYVCSCGWQGRVSDDGKMYDSNYFSPEDADHEFEQHRRDATESKPVTLWERINNLASAACRAYKTPDYVVLTRAQREDTTEFGFVPRVLNTSYGQLPVAVSNKGPALFCTDGSCFIIGPSGEPVQARFELVMIERATS